MSKAVPRPYLDAIAEVGFEVESTTYGKHIKIWATHPKTGASRHMIVVPCSPGRGRGFENFRAELRRRVNQPGRS